MYINEKLKQDFILLGLRIKKLREKRNLTIEEVSRKTSIRSQYLQKIENGKAYGVLVIKHLLKIAVLFKIKLSELLDYN